MVSETIKDLSKVLQPDGVNGTRSDPGALASWMDLSVTSLPCRPLAPAQASPPGLASHLVQGGPLSQQTCTEET